jgi:hypothetical protein
MFMQEPYDSGIIQCKEKKHFLPLKQSGENKKINILMKQQFRKYRPTNLKS